MVCGVLLSTVCSLCLLYVLLAVKISADTFLCLHVFECVCVCVCVCVFVYMCEHTHTHAHTRKLRNWREWE